MESDKFSLSFISRMLILWSLLALLAFTLYFENLYAILSAVIGRLDSSHGVFIPLFSGYLLWLKRNKLKNQPFNPHMLIIGLLFLVGTITFFLGKHTLYSQFFGFLSFLCIAGSLINLLFGNEVFKELTFPLFFLVTMTPVPKDVYAFVTEQMRQMSTWGSVVVTRALGVPLYQEGYNIYLTKKNLFIAEGCSGIRYLLSYLYFSMFYAVLFKQGIFTRLTFILSSIPLSILAGITRLAAIFVSVHYISPVFGDRRPHIVLSWAVFVVFLVGVIGADQYLFNHKTERQR